MTRGNVALALLCLLPGLTLFDRSAKAGNLQLAVAGPAAPVIAAPSGSCGPTDTPDANARAFRDARGDVHLFATGMVNHGLVGSTLETVKEDCRISYQAGNDPNPADFDHHHWLTSFFTADGTNVVALVHSEFDGWETGKCAMVSPGHCWNNSITEAFSTDGGYTFREPPAPANLVATLPYQYNPKFVQPSGYMSPINIVKRGNFYYSIMRAIPYGSQKFGACAIRTATPTDPSSWRAWDGSDYTVSFVDPYVAKTFNPSAHVCEPLNAVMYDIGSLGWHVPSQQFILVEYIQQNQYGPAGFYSMTSPDLITWSAPSLIVSSQALVAEDTGGKFSYGYPSLIDPNATDLSFNEITASPYLFYVKQDLKHMPYGRVLVRRKVTIAPQS